MCHAGYSLFVSQFFNRLNDLPDLVWLCLSFCVLSVDTWIAWPRRFENGMTAAGLPWFAKVGFAQFFEIVEMRISGIPAHRRIVSRIF